MQNHTVATLTSAPVNMNGLWVSSLDVNRSTAATLPPDPDNLNDLRAQRADDALVKCEGQCEDVGLQTVSDLLSQIAHWCDRNSLQMADAMSMAATTYSDETEAQGRQFTA